MSDTVTLTIDGQEVTVPKGTTLLDAAAAVGIIIPIIKIPARDVINETITIVIHTVEVISVPHYSIVIQVFSGVHPNITLQILVIDSNPTIYNSDYNSGTACCNRPGFWCIDIGIRTATCLSGIV